MTEMKNGFYGILWDAPTLWIEGKEIKKPDPKLLMVLKKKYLFIRGKLEVSDNDFAFFINVDDKLRPERTFSKDLIEEHND